jgi:hypothetical protein
MSALRAALAEVTETAARLPSTWRRRWPGRRACRGRVAR